MKTVKKIWGGELIITNNILYCGKILTLKKDFHCSFHKHFVKDEVFYILEGRVLMELEDMYRIMNEGEEIQIKPGVFHRFSGLTDATIIEFSTHHKDSDTTRLSKSGKVKIIFVDIDGFICTDEKGHYEKVKPFSKRVGQVNIAYEEGNRIIIWTARGTTDGKDYRQLTEKQLEEWGVKYHELRFGKPYYDEWWDDRAKLS